MSSVDYIQVKTDWYQESLDLNLNQFSSSTNINHILNILSEVAEGVEIDIVTLSESFLLVNAEGDQLDVIGEETGLPRTSDVDEDYKSAIVLKSSTNFYSVVDEDISQLLVFLGGDPEPEVYSGHYKLVEVHLQETCKDKQQVYSTLLEILPPTTQALAVFSKGTPFGFEGDTSSSSFGTVGEEDTTTDGLTAVYLGE